MDPNPNPKPYIHALVYIYASHKLRVHITYS